MRRDNQIALWEAFRREQSTQRCMLNAGFNYFPDVAYPDEELIAVADSLGVSRTKGAKAPAVANQEVVAGLDEKSLDLYYGALYGASAQQMSAFEASGGESADDTFAKGGCVGRASVEVGSIWEARRAIEPEMTTLRAQIASDVAADYRACASQYGFDAASPGDLEFIGAPADIPDGEAQQVLRALNECADDWDAAYDAAEAKAAPAFILDHPDVFEKNATEYAAAPSSLEKDETFRSYLSIAAGVIQDAREAAAAN